MVSCLTKSWTYLLFAGKGNLPYWECLGGSVLKSVISNEINELSSDKIASQSKKTAEK